MHCDGAWDDTTLEFYGLTCPEARKGGLLGSAGEQLDAYDWRVTGRLCKEHRLDEGAAMAVGNFDYLRCLPSSHGWRQTKEQRAAINEE